MFTNLLKLKFNIKQKSNTIILPKINQNQIFNITNKFIKTKNFKNIQRTKYTFGNLTNETNKNLINYQIKFYLKMENTNKNQTLLNKEDTLKFLDQNKIDYFVEDHEQANTVQEGLERVRTEKLKPEDYTFVKNLFLKNKAGGFYLITAHNTTTTDFKILHKLFKAKNGNIRNAEKDQLQTYLKVAPGSVNPFSLINLDGNQKNEVKFCIDKAITTEYIAVHPMINTSTVFLKTKSLLNLLEQNKIQVEIMEIKDTEEEKDNNNNKEEKKPAEKKQTEKPKKVVEKKEVDEKSFKEIDDEETGDLVSRNFFEQKV